MAGDSKTIKTERRRFLGSAAGLAILASGCSFTPPVLRLGFNPWPGYEFFKLAEQLGFYRQLGLNIHLVEFTSLGDSRRAFERQQIDIAAGTAVELLTASATLRQPVQAFFLTNRSVGSDYLIAKPPYSQPAHLKGKRVAVEPGSLNLLLLHLAMQSAALKLQDLQLVPMSQASMPAAFSRGEVDAVVVYPPIANEFLAHLPAKAHVLFDSSQIPEAIIDILYARQEILEQRRGELAALVRGFEMAREYASKQPDDAYARMAARTGQQRDDFERDMRGLRLVPLAEQAPLFQPAGQIEQTLHEALLALRDAGMTLSLQSLGLTTPGIIELSLKS